ncbi:MAG: ATP-binding cassette domain-containing protein [Deltaproteobacteria bacterium]|jgi:iron complex transport system ATP-binding protein|nr:ATP-binding cassette domain-containing protein [Deltaproteobacteria bacterium]
MTEEVEKIVVLDEVVLKRGGTTLLKNVNWRVEPGQHWALLGPNGAGKTLILRLVNGYIWPTDGRITVLGRRLGEYDLRLLRRRIGWVSEALADLMPGHTNLKEVIVSGYLASLGLYAAPTPEMVEKAEYLAEQFGLSEALTRPFAHLSSGERQRALLARASLAEPELLILDEPMSNLDMGGREFFLRALRRIAAEPKAPTIILTTHNIQEIAPFMTHAIVIKGGTVVKAGSKEETLTADCLGQAFDLDLVVEKTSSGRFIAYMANDENGEKFDDEENLEKRENTFI